MTRTLQILRTNYSSYQRPEYLKLEENELGSLPGIHYLKSQKELDPRLPWALITNTHTRFDILEPELYQKAQFMIHPNSGYDNFPVNIAKGPVPVILGNEIRAEAVRDYILSRLMSAHCPPLEHFEWPGDRFWDRPLLTNQTIQLYGHGRIGKELAVILKLLAKKVMVHDPYQGLDQDSPHEADVVIFCQGLNAQNRQSFGPEFFERLKDNVILINSARGELIQEEALVHFFKAHPRAQACLDVFMSEPKNFDDLNDLPNLKKTAHMAGCFDQLNEAIIAFEKKVLDDFLRKENFWQLYQDNLLSQRLGPDGQLI